MLQCIAGGPVIDFDSKVLGISEANKKGSFVPSSIVLKWLHLWRNYRYAFLSFFFGSVINLIHCTLFSNL